MNARQAAKAAAKRIEELEDFNRRASGDIKAYNACIDSVIAGEKSFCDWCEENGECQQPEKKLKSGCENWWLRMDHGMMTEDRMVMTGEPEPSGVIVSGKDADGGTVEGGE